MPQEILIVDDDPTQRRLLQGLLQRDGFTTKECPGGQEAIDLLTSAQASSISLVLLDLVMPNVDGMAVLEKVRPILPELPVIVLTAQGGIETVVAAMQGGANDFVVKPASPERLRVSIKNCLELSTLSGEVTRLKRQRTGLLTFQDLIAKSPTMQQVIRLGERASKSNIPILVEGESGVGKELIARAIQGSSDRSGKPFVTVNCGAIPENLVESILFGHEKGAFTGANEKHAGKFKEADGGTLFLDEIGELRLDIQVKLLRALQEGEVDPIGARRPVKIDIRLISATNRDLLEMVREGDFREDLYYRLNVFPIQVPPLRDRPEDIADLIHHFIRRFATEEKKHVVGIEREALALLQSYSWPGNVRQLENSVFRAVVLSDSAELTARDFPQIAKFLGVPASPGLTGLAPAPAPAAPRPPIAPPMASAPTPGATPAPPPAALPAGLHGGALPAETAAAHAAHEANGNGPAAAGSTTPGSATSGAGRYEPKSLSEMAGLMGNAYPRDGMDQGGSIDELPLTDAEIAEGIPALGGDGHVRTLEDIESELIKFAIDKYSGQMSEIARRLGIGRSTLYRKVRDLGIDVRGTGTDM